MSRFYIIMVAVQLSLLLSVGCDPDTGLDSDLDLESMQTVDAGTINLSRTHPFSDDTAILFADENLENAVREVLSKPSGTITFKDAKAVTHLTADNQGIADLGGLEFFTNLTFINLSLNRITDISNFSGLTNLTWVDLSANEIENIHGLGNLANLTVLRLFHNQISDISILGRLTNLNILGLCHNEIADISVLRKLTNLTWLQATTNHIVDIDALGDLKHLTWVDLSSNEIESIGPLLSNTGIGTYDLVNLDANPIDCEDPDIAELLTSGVTLHTSCEPAE